MLLAILLTAVALSYYPWLQDGTSVFITAVQPGYLDFDNLPETNFSCERKVIGGYYADVETGCQMFHVCTIGQKSEVTDIKFLCLNGTVFDQETRVCERLDEVDCSKSESFFDLNLELYGNNAQGQGIQPEDGNEESTTECEDPDSGCGNEMEYPDEETTALSITSTSSTSTTPKPFITTTTTRRPSSTTVSKFHQDTYSSTTPDTVAQLLALHEAFQESLKRTTAKPNASKTTAVFSSVLDTRNRFPNSQKTTLSPVPPKLPSTVTNLSRNNNMSGLNNFKNSYNIPKPNTPLNKNSQKVSNRPDVTFTPPNVRNHQPVVGHGILQSSRNTPYTSRPVNNPPISLVQIHHNPDSIKSNLYDSTSFQSNYYPPSNTRPAPFQLFKIEQPQTELQYSTPSILQGRPFSLHLVQDAESNNKDSESDDYVEARPFTSHFHIERVDEKPNHQSQSHSSITRAIGTKDTKTPNNITSADKMVSVVLSTSSVSSSKSFMLPSSAIHKNNTPIVVNNTKINNNNNNNLQSSTNEPENIEFVYEDEYEYEDTDTATPLYTDVPKIKL